MIDKQKNVNNKLKTNCTTFFKKRKLLMRINNYKIYFKMYTFKNNYLKNTIRTISTILF